MPTPAELKAQIDALTAQYAEAMKAPPPPATTPVKLDLGCGPNKQPGHIGVDERQFPGVDVVCNLGNDRWPWADESVDEVHCAHMVEHLTPPQRIHFTNELFRVLKHGGKATIITPHWCSHRAYGDLTHQWPPVSEMWFGYLNAAWRKANAPHNDTYTCDFEYPVAIGYQPSPWLQAECASRNPEFVQKQTQEALTKFKEAAADMLATLVKGKS